MRSHVDDKRFRIRLRPKVGLKSRPEAKSRYLPSSLKATLVEPIPFVRHRRLLLVGNGINVNAGQIILFRARPGDPLAVGRPIVGLNLAPFILIYLSDRFVATST